MPHNQLLHCICNIGTADNLLFTKYLISELQECFVKVIYPLEFLQFHQIAIPTWNEQSGWIHTIWIWNSKTLLLLFHEFIFPHTSPIIWLICSCQLFCLYFPFFFQSNDLLPPLHVASYWVIVRTTCYNELPLVTCRVNYWRNRYFLIILLRQHNQKNQQISLEIQHSFIYFIRFTYASTSSEIIYLRRAEEVSVEVIFIGYHRSKKISDAKLCIIKNG